MFDYIKQELSRKKQERKFGEQKFEEKAEPRLNETTTQSKVVENYQ